MAKRRPSGDGMVRKREDGCLEGRIVIDHKENGDPIFRYICADTQKELTVNLRQNITTIRAWITQRRAECSSRSGWSRWPPSSGPVPWITTAVTWSTM